MQVRISTRSANTHNIFMFTGKAHSYVRAHDR